MSESSFATEMARSAHRLAGQMRDRGRGWWAVCASTRVGSIETVGVHMPTPTALVQVLKNHHHNGGVIVFGGSDDPPDVIRRDTSWLSKVISEYARLEKGR